METVARYSPLLNTSWREGKWRDDAQLLHNLSAFIACSRDAFRCAWLYFPKAWSFLTIFQEFKSIMTVPLCIWVKVKYDLNWLLLITNGYERHRLFNCIFQLAERLFPFSCLSWGVVLSNISFYYLFLMRVRKLSLTLSHSLYRMQVRSLNCVKGKSQWLLSTVLNHFTFIWHQNWEVGPLALGQSVFLHFSFALMNERPTKRQYKYKQEEEQL